MNSALIQKSRGSKCSRIFGTVLFLVCFSYIAKAEKVVDLGQLEIEGELRRPNVQWVDSNKKIKEYIVRIYTEQFRRLEDELLKPMTKPQFRAELQKEERLVSN